MGIWRWEYQYATSLMTHDFSNGHQWLARKARVGQSFAWILARRGGRLLEGGRLLRGESLGGGRETWRVVGGELEGVHSEGVWLGKGQTKSGEGDSDGVSLGEKGDTEQPPMSARLNRINEVAVSFSRKVHCAVMANFCMRCQVWSMHARTYRWTEVCPLCCTGLRPLRSHCPKKETILIFCWFVV